MQINFNFQLDASGNPTTEETFEITSLSDYRRSGLDYAFLQVAGNPQDTYGIQVVNTTDAPAAGATLAIIGHPSGEPKQVDVGNMTSTNGTQLLYGDVDTLGGNSGSGVLNEAGELIGVHTNGGCMASGGANSGVLYTAIVNSFLE